MLTWHRTSVLLFLASSLLRAQLVVENPKRLEVPDEQARVLFLTTMRVMEKEFHAPGSLENTLRLRLVLGEKAERFTIDDPAGNGTVYMEKWNEGKFAVAAMRLAIQHLLVPDRQKRMLEEIVRRTREIAPVKASQLRNERMPVTIPEIQGECAASIANAAVPGRPCQAGQVRPHPTPIPAR